MKLYDLLSRVSYGIVVSVRSRSSNHLVFYDLVDEFFKLDKIDNMPCKYYYDRLIKEINVSMNVLNVIIQE